jgi:hypothetical protein
VKESDGGCHVCPQDTSFFNAPCTCPPTAWGQPQHWDPDYKHDRSGLIGACRPNCPFGWYWVGTKYQGYCQQEGPGFCPSGWNWSDGDRTCHPNCKPGSVWVDNQESTGPGMGGQCSKPCPLGQTYYADYWADMTGNTGYCHEICSGNSVWIPDESADGQAGHCSPSCPGGATWAADYSQDPSGHVGNCNFPTKQFDIPAAGSLIIDPLGPIAVPAADLGGP